MKPHRFVISLFQILFIIGWCAGIVYAQNRNIDLSETYRLKAAKHITSGDYQKALILLKAAGSLNPDNPEISAKLAEITSKASQLAETHYQKGVSLFQKNALDDALKEFLTALRYQPDHQNSIEYVKQKLYDSIYLSYTVKSGDDLKSIARNVYKDPEKQFVIAYFNQLNPEAVLRPGTTLKIPILDMVDVQKSAGSDPKEIDIDKLLDQAKTLFASKRYDKVIAISKQILDKDYLNEEASNLGNASYYELGISFFAEKKYKEALDMLNKAEPSYPGVSDAIANIRSVSKKEADHHYKEGVKHFVNDQLEKAIQEWEITLTLEPDHKNASKDIENAKKLLEKLNKVQ